MLGRALAGLPADDAQDPGTAAGSAAAGDQQEAVAPEEVQQGAASGGAAGETLLPPTGRLIHSLSTVSDAASDTSEASDGRWDGLPASGSGPCCIKQ